MMRLRGLWLGLGMAGLTALGAACGGGGESGAPSGPTATTTPAAQAPPSTAAAVDDEDVEPLLVWADSDTDEGDAPLTIKFLADVEGGKQPLKYTWTFGDGSPDSSEANPTHVYKEPGYYQAELFVTDATGDEDSDFLEIEVFGDEEE